LVVWTLFPFSLCHSHGLFFPPGALGNLSGFRGKITVASHRPIHGFAPNLLLRRFDLLIFFPLSFPLFGHPLLTSGAFYLDFLSVHTCPPCFNRYHFRFCICHQTSFSHPDGTAMGNRPLVSSLVPPFLFGFLLCFFPCVPFRCRPFEPSFLILSIEDRTASTLQCRRDILFFCVPPVSSWRGHFLPRARFFFSGFYFIYGRWREVFLGAPASAGSLDPFEQPRDSNNNVASFGSPSFCGPQTSPKSLVLYPPPICLFFSFLCSSVPPASGFFFPAFFSKVTGCGFLISRPSFSFLGFQPPRACGLSSLFFFFFGPFPGEGNSDVHKCDPYVPVFRPLPSDKRPPLCLFFVPLRVLFFEPGKSDWNETFCSWCH